MAGFKWTHDRNPHKSWQNGRELAEKQRVAVILIFHTYTRRGIHPPGKLPTFLMYFHFCAFKFIQFFPYCCLINNNDICNHKKYEFSGKQSWKKCIPTLAGALQLPFPFSFTVIHTSHILLIFNKNDFSTTAVQSTHPLQRNAKHQAPKVNQETPNQLQWVNKAHTEIEHFYQQKWARGWITLTITCWVGRQEGDSVSRLSPEELVSQSCLHRHWAHSRALISPLWRQDFRNPRWTALLFFLKWN